MASKFAIAALFTTVAVAAVALYVSPPVTESGGAPADLPPLVDIGPGAYSYRAAGDFRQGTRVVDAPLETRMAETGFEIMQYPVSRADYAECVAAGACADAGTPADADLAQTGVSFRDAVAYADWFSRATGQVWRLPTDAEWVRAAGSRYVDETLGAEAGAEGDDPAARWLDEYAKNIELRETALPALQPIGSHGANEFGVVDLAGNVWEWTDSCMQNAQMEADGATVAQASQYCGVRVAEGQHRALIIDFVRDARAGGCAVGLPPDYLGFRLVRDQ